MGVAESVRTSIEVLNEAIFSFCLTPNLCKTENILLRVRCQNQKLLLTSTRKILDQVKQLGYEKRFQFNFHLPSHSMEVERSPFKIYILTFLQIYIYTHTCVYFINDFSYEKCCPFTLTTSWQATTVTTHRICPHRQLNISMRQEKIPIEPGIPKGFVSICR